VIWHWNTDPILLHLGPLRVHWYGLLFAAGLFLAYTLVRRFVRREGIDPQKLEPIFLAVVVGVVAGARLVHCLFYEPGYYLAHPLEIFAVWRGGLASHGGILGGILGLWWGARRQGIDPLWLLSRTAAAGLFAAVFIRIGNFFNSEILGRPTDGPWGVVFARIDTLPRHPVMLYEAAAYGVILILMLLYLRRARPTREYSLRLLGWTLLLIFFARIVLERFKIPQADYGAQLPLSVGQLLSLPFVLAGIALILAGTILSRRSRS
jgi:prolipoprotein diacylglyceryl transferase